MKRLVLASIAMLALVFFTTVYPASAFTHDQYAVEDESGILSEEEKSDLTDYAFTMQEKTGAEFLVLIRPTLEGEPVEQFAYEQFTKRKLGQAKDDNGLLLVMTTERDPMTDRRELYVMTGYGLEGALPDGKVGRMIDELAMPYLEQGQPNEAVLALYKGLYNEVMKEYGMENEQLLVETPNGPYDGPSDDGESVPFWVIVLIIIIVIAMSSGNRGGRGGGGRGGGGPIIFFPPSSGGGGGSSSGGGFGGFGGGGSTGGGGAGRSW